MPRPRNAKVRRLTALAPALALVLGVSGCVTPERPGGPLQVRVQHPVQLTVLRMEPVSATTLTQGDARVDVGLSYSSLFLRGGSTSPGAVGDGFVMDGEILRVGIGARYGITDRVQVDCVLPVLHTSAGFLDHAIRQFHDFVGASNVGREMVEDDQYDVRATRDGMLVYELDEQDIALGDVPIGVQWQLVQPVSGQPFGLAARGAIELPTGNDDRGFGNGGIDWSVGLVGELRTGPFTWTAHVEHTFAHTPDLASDTGVDYRDVTSGGVGVEVAWTQDTAVLVQVEADRSVLRELHDVHTDVDQWMLWIGLRSRLTPDFAMELGFGEDMSRDAPPDFTAFLGFRLDIGR